MRVRLLNIPAIARATGFAAVAVAIIVAGVHLARHSTSVYAEAHLVAPHGGALARELSRCEKLDATTKKEEQETCETAWAENRHRFFDDKRASNITALRAGDLQPNAKPEGR